MKKVLGIIVVILLCLISFFLYKEYFDNKDIITSVFKAQDNKDKILYNNCLNSSYKYDGIDDDFNEFVSVYKNNVAIYFKDINNDYVLEYNSNKIFYSASTSKVFMVIYLIEQYRNNNLDLETKLV